MLIRATFQNMFSFNGPETLSFIAGKTQGHPNHVYAGSNRYEPNILKTALIYGANASGKSNLIKCFDLVRRLILKGSKVDELINRTPFKLCLDTAEKPSRFEIELKTEGDIYSYSASFTEKEIIEERLTKIGKTTEKDLFSRTVQEGELAITAGSFLKKTEDRKFFEFIARGTRPNQLFLKESIERNCDWFRPVYNWFKDRLVIIYPGSTFNTFELLVRPDGRLKDNYHEFFELLGLGIQGVEVREMDFENDAGILPPRLKDDIKKTLPVEKSITVFNTASGRYRFTRDKTGVIKCFKLMVEHQCSDGSDPVFFEIEEESDGTKRLIDLIPALVDAAEANRIFLIDEIDRSMHAQLSRAFFEYFFLQSPGQSQLVATTHELDLLDLDLMRKDEIWFIEKDKDSASHLYSLEDFKPRYDKDIRRGYLQGRFGAIPIVKNIEAASWSQ